MKPGVKPGSERFNIQSWDDLRLAIAQMKPRTKLYTIVKEELTKQGRWKNAPRGAMFQKGDDPKKHKLQ